MLKSAWLSRLSDSVFFPYVTLLLWALPLLLLSNGQVSLMAHDEGHYALQARWILETGDWITPPWWGQPLYDRTIGIQWLIATCFALFGLNEGSARLPSLLASVGSLLLTYEIGKILLNQRLAWLATAILSVMALWVQYGRLATQDATLVFLELLGMWALLQAEQHPQKKFWWAMLAGSTLGLGFLIKGFMIALPPVALSLYLLFDHRRHHHLTNPGLYSGILLGASPPMLWLWASYTRYGTLPFEQLFGKLLVLGNKDWYGAGPLYYVWNIPANSFPWTLFTLIGFGLVLQPGWKVNPSGLNRRWLLLGYPTLLFLELSCFKTRTPYYPLQLLPFAALLAAIALDWCLQIYSTSSKPGTRLWGSRQSLQWAIALLSYAFGGLALLLILIGSLGLVGKPVIADLADPQINGAMVLLGCAWSALALLWLGRSSGSGPAWLASWLIGPWLTLALLTYTGLLGNYSPDLKAGLQQAAIAPILHTQSIDLVVPGPVDGEVHKTWLLLGFYTPNVGRRFEHLSEVSTGYVWVSPQEALAPSYDYQPLGTVQGWQLIQVPKPRQ